MASASAMSTPSYSRQRSSQWTPGCGPTTTASPPFPTNRITMCSKRRSKLNLCATVCDWSRVPTHSFRVLHPATAGWYVVEDGMALVASARIRAKLKAHHSTEYVSFPRSPDHHRAGWGVRALSRLFLVVLVVSLVQMNVPSPTAGAAVLGNDYPANLANAPKDSVIDPWKFYNRECTSFVAWRLNNTNGVAFNDFYGGPQWGNASNWGVAARSVGITVDNTPAVGWVAWNATNGGADGSEGHVAWVANVEANGTVDIEEYNANIVGGYDIRYGLSTASFSGFIHVRDLVATDPSGNPSGNLELAARTSGGVEVVGWAADPNAGNNPVSVQMLVDGTPTGPIGTAALPRSDV